MLTFVWINIRWILTHIYILCYIMCIFSEPMLDSFLCVFFFFVFIEMMKWKWQSAFGLCGGNRYVFVYYLIKWIFSTRIAMTNDEWRLLSLLRSTRIWLWLSCQHIIFTTSKHSMHTDRILEFHTWNEETRKAYEIEINFCEKSKQTSSHQNEKNHWDNREEKKCVSASNEEKEANEMAKSMTSKSFIHTKLVKFNRLKVSHLRREHSHVNCTMCFAWDYDIISYKY